jgi:hypothetical protein
MNYAISLKKCGLGILTFIISYLIANPQLLSNIIPEKVMNMTIGSIISGLIVFAANWLKNKDK